MTDKRKHCVNVRMNQPEIDRLDTMRGEQSRGGYLRAAFFSDRRKLPPPVVNIAICNEIISITTHLNQCTHLFNMGEVNSDLVSDTVRTLSHLKAHAIAAVSTPPCPSQAKNTATNSKQRQLKTKKNAGKVRKYVVSAYLNPAELLQLDAARGNETRGGFVRSVFFASSRPMSIPQLNLQLNSHVLQTHANLSQLTSHFINYGLDISLITEITETLNNLRCFLLNIILVDIDAELDEFDEPETLEPALNKDF